MSGHKYRIGSFHHIKNTLFISMILCGWTNEMFNYFWIDNISLDVNFSKELFNSCLNMIDASMRFAFVTSTD